MLKKILIAVAAIVVIFVIVVVMQPSEYRVERSETISAPAADAFAQVNNFHKWEAWSPWAKLDPAAKVSFEGPDEGAGAVLGWAGNNKVGEGKMTLTESQPNDRIKITTDFVRPFEGTNTTEFTFKPDGDQTVVSWSISGHQGFIAKAFCLVMNGKKMMGDTMQQGLTQLKSVVESASKT